MRRRYPAICLLLAGFLAGCPALDDTRPFLDGQNAIAHAGGMAAGRRYTNSLEALESNYSRGFRVFEIDLSWTRDRELVLIHDWDQTWARLFDRSETPSLDEFIAANMVDDLTSLTLQGAMDWLSSRPDAYFITDIKDENIAALTRISSEYDTSRIVPQIYEVEEFAAARDLGFPTVILTVYRSSSTPQEIIDFAMSAPLWAVTAPHYQIERGDYDALLERSRPLVFTHTINDPQVWSDLNDKGVDAIYTDTLFIQASD